MPFRTSTSPQYYVITVTGHFDYAEALDLVSTVEAERSAMIPVIVDCTELVSTDIGYGHVLTLLELSSSTLPRFLHLPVAFVSPSDLAYGLSRMVQFAAGSAIPMRVFRTLEAATAWLEDQRVA